MPSRPTGFRSALLSASVPAVLTIAVALAAACQNANTMTAPAGTASPVSANLAGAWSGSFQPYDSGCGGTSASASFQQTGSAVTGSLKTSDCGVAGYFRGTLQGNTLLGTLEMQGCTGGGVSGTIEGARLSLTIGDMTKPLVTGDTPRMSGGAVLLSR
jgi:hypothetical protein